jgi:hypothetical protein
VNWKRLHIVKAIRAANLGKRFFHHVFLTRGSADVPMKSALRVTAKTIAGVQVARPMIGTPARVLALPQSQPIPQSEQILWKSLAFP